MKKILFIATLAAAVLGACTKQAAISAPEPQWYTNQAYFEEKNGMYEEMPIYPTNIVMVGDDYIDRGLWNEFYGDTAVKNRGITYDATEHVRYRIGRIAAQKPAKIFVSVGYNDVLHGTAPESIVAAIDDIFTTISKISPATDCYWLNIVGSSSLPAEQVAAIDQVNAEVANLSSRRSFNVIDICSALRPGVDEGRFSWDGGKLLNGTGYEALCSTLDEKVGKPHLNRADEKEYPLEVSDYYRHRASLLRSLPSTEGKIVMLGNSLNNNAPWAELIPLDYVLNRGISGDVIDGVCQRLDELENDNPVKIFLMTGTNDLINEPDIAAVKVWERYEHLLREIRRMYPGTILYVQSILPLNPKTKFYEGFNEKAAEINKLLSAGMDRYDYFYLDIAEKLSDANGDLDARYTTDGIHLSATGYFVWCTELVKGNRMMNIF